MTARDRAMSVLICIAGGAGFAVLFGAGESMAAVAEIAIGVLWAGGFLILGVPRIYELRNGQRGDDEP